MAVGTGSGAVLVPKHTQVVIAGREEVTRSGNPMDSSAPTARRGKEREGPKKKKMSALRKVTR